MKVLGLLTGRGNNTLKDKNIIDINGKPTLWYIANSGIKSNIFDYTYCSSDDDNILKIANEIGYLPIKRPDELAKPNSQHIDTIKHALNYLKEKNICPDIIVVLLANNVTVSSKWIKDCVNIMKQKKCSAVVPVIKDNDHHPLRAKYINDLGQLVSYEINNFEANSSNRQDLVANYFLSHNFWVLNVESIKKGEVGTGPWPFMGTDVIPYVIDESIDIHTIKDVEIAKEWLKNNYED